MPEGDTIHALAGALGRELTGHRVTGFELRGRPPVHALVGCEVRAVRAWGKNTFIELDDAAVLWVHLGMYGRWSWYPAGDRRGEGLRGALLRLATERLTVACFEAKTVELLRPRDLATHPKIATLGPDLVLPDVDLGVVLARVRQRLHDARPSLRELLLDQRIAAGIGNIFQAETLFLERLHPDTDPRDLDDSRIEAVYARASALLAANVGAVPRVFTAGLPSRHLPGEHGDHGNRTWVYERGGRPCRVCATPIVRRGESASDRVTWWCPACQPAPTAAAWVGGGP
ncbi:Fpg/Nei family DNA glycosylase [Engelhardtia mirabilis]|uniref:DNA-(apurinic or apyrimidinic site) lyase n=1 Tax=Engelhardtia mirabilis TaxID=2528011 RepID=A0A518BDM6_9BACT|nr:Endonuclease 8 [Planctomycetes bacterium Pla133]QDU99414.1 Endonuclease 8 [Planctomycetes bacterium Pla86]